jgi:peptidoglycan/xylan/chitin deacetylase (PgdA/CDA1 family)
VLKRVSAIATENAIFSRFVSVLEAADQREHNLLRVLTYHRVDEPSARPNLYPGLISATPALFEQQMQYLASNYHVLSMAELLEAHSRNRVLPPRSVLITFDDACCDFAEHAWPILKRYNLPATVFVPTAFPDQPERVFWWDQLYHAVHLTPRRDTLATPLGPQPLQTAKQRGNTFRLLKDYVKTLPHEEAMAWVEQICEELDAGKVEHNVLGWDALRTLAREGVTLGAHTQTHPLVNRVSPKQAHAEALGSLRDLERQIGQVLPIFAYPSGGFNDEVVQILKRAGFQMAFTTESGINDMASADPLRMLRLNIGRRTTLPVFRARLLPWSHSLGRLRNRLRVAQAAH